MNNNNGNPPPNQEFTDPAFNQPADEYEDMSVEPEGYGQEDVRDDEVDPAADDSQALPITDEEPVGKPDPAAKPEMREYYDVFNDPVDSEDITIKVPSERTTTAVQEEMLRSLGARLRDELDEKKAYAILKRLIEDEEMMDLLLYSDGEYNDFFDNHKVRQYIRDEEGKVVRCHHPNFKPKSGGELKGHNAVRYVGALMGVSRPTAQQMWNSGVTVRLDNIPESHMLSLQEVMSQTNVVLGLSTKGAAFSGDDIYLAGTILEFLLDHVLDSTMDENAGTKLGDVLLITDAPALMAAGLAAVYPKGYPVFHSCINVPSGKCDYTIEAERDELDIYKPDAMLDFKKVIWADTDRISPAKASIFNRPINSVSTKEIAEYQQDVRTVTNESLDFTFKHSDHEYRVHFAVPSINKYINVTNAWVASVGEMVDRILAKDSELSDSLRQERRMNLMAEQSTVLDINKHAAWVESVSIHYPDGTNHLIKDDATLEKVLQEACKMTGFHEGFTKAVQTFKENVTIAAAGINNFACPKCGAGQVEGDAKFKSLIPVNMVSYFFTLTELMTTSVLNRRA